MSLRARLPYTLLLLLLALPAGAGVEPPASPVEPARIDAVFSDFDRTGAPGCSLGVVRDGRLAYARGYGMANLDHGIALGPRSVFRIASTSKQFTAAVLLLLARDGALALDDDVREYVPQLRAYERPVTIRQLIHHTSGYRDYLALMHLGGWRDEDWISDEQAVDLLARQRELNFEPGSQHLYSNSGYFLLSQVVRGATGKSLRQLAEEKIFAPLEMRSTHFHDDHKRVVPERAVGYAPREEGGFEVSMTTLDMVGDGGVFTTVEDLARWDRVFYDGSLGEGFGDQMLASAVLPGGNDTGYAFGLTVSEYRGLTRVAHGGSFVGYRAQMIRFPEHRLSVICLCNRSDANPTRLAQAVADLYLAELAPEATKEAVEEAAEPAPPFAVPAELLAARAGGYRRAGEGTVIEMKLEEGRLVYTTSRGSYPLRPLSRDRFALEEAPVAVEVEFQPADDGARASFLARVEGEDEPRRYEPVELVALAPEEVLPYAGDYACDELATTLRLTAVEGKLEAAHADPHKRRFEEPLAPTVADTFSGDGLTLEFERRGDEPPHALRIQFGRVKNLLCVRR